MAASLPTSPVRWRSWDGDGGWWWRRCRRPWGAGRGGTRGARRGRGAFEVHAVRVHRIGDGHAPDGPGIEGHQDLVTTRVVDLRAAARGIIGRDLVEGRRPNL